MMNFFKYVLPCAILLFTACNSQVSDDANVATAQSDAQIKQNYTFEKQAYTIGKLPKSSTYEFTGVIVRGENTAAIAKINAAVELAQKNTLVQEKTDVQNKTVQQLIDEEIESWHEFSKEEFFIGYDKNVLFKGHTTKDLVVIEYTAYEMTGGAHGNGYTAFMNFDAKSGEAIPNQKLFKNIAEVEKIVLPLFIEKAKSHFEVNNINPSDLNSAGFQFEDNKFVLSTNITIEGNNVIFYYNPYEIGPYAMGDFLLEIPIEKLSNQLLFN